MLSKCLWMNWIGNYLLTGARYYRLGTPVTQMGWLNLGILLWCQSYWYCLLLKIDETCLNRQDFEPQTAQVTRLINLAMVYDGSSKGKGLQSYLEVGKTYIATSL